MTDREKDRGEKEESEREEGKIDMKREVEEGREMWQKGGKEEKEEGKRKKSLFSVK